MLDNEKDNIMNSEGSDLHNEELETFTNTEVNPLLADVDDDIDEDVVEEVSDVVEESVPEVDEEKEELKRLNQERLEQIRQLQKEQEQLREEQESQMLIDDESIVTDLSYGLQNIDGELISTRQVGTVALENIPIHQLQVPKRLRQMEQDITELQEQITMFGQLTPIHVVPFGNYYLLLDGYRRLEVARNTGKESIYAYIDGTIPPTLVKFYEALCNSIKKYKFSEMVGYGMLIKETQPKVSFETIDSILQLRSGDFLKALYIDSMKGQFPEIYDQVEKGKLSIEQASKKIDKEIEKLEKEQTAGLDALNDGSLDDELRNTDALRDMMVEAQQQELGNRKLLDPVTRRFVENRDGGYCQCCEFGKGEPDFMGAFNVHHIIPVQYGGSDAKTNLILLCNNCHTLVHDYEKGRFIPERETYEKFDSVKKIIVLGNMLVTMRKKAFKELKRNHIEVFRQVDAGKLTLGQGLVKANINLGGEQYFEGSPYDVFMQLAEDILKGNGVQGELGQLSYEDDKEMAENTVVENVESVEDNDTESVMTIPNADDEFNLADDFEPFIKPETEEKIEVHKDNVDLSELVEDIEVKEVAKPLVDNADDEDDDPFDLFNNLK